MDRTDGIKPRRGIPLCLVAISLLLAPPAVLGDGVMRAPRDYPGSVEERAQEAIIVFHGSTTGEAVEDLILKVRVDGEVKAFGWIIPFPNKPEVEKEDARLFKELFDYVQIRRPRKKGKGKLTDSKPAGAEEEGVKVLSRKIVGSYDVAVVRETKAGTLNAWLEDAGYQTLKSADDVLGFYREKGYVYACIKVSDAALEEGKGADLHPLRFTFKTGGRDGIYYPMKMTGLQSAPFDVNLYVFYGAWINQKINRYGFVHRGFHLNYRDWDSPSCEPNAGKTWSAPETDPFLKGVAPRIPATKAFFQRRNPGGRYYLTNIQAWGLKPDEVRRWKTDLWLFPHYTDPGFVPYDARQGGPAFGAYPELPKEEEREERKGSAPPSFTAPFFSLIALFAVIVAALAGVLFYFRWESGTGGESGP
ncbi:MAG: DUF2330 domain-containing protein [Planctomycetota bacterium]